jgi:murein DD-endopeptidase MepM/ murein hydrolase activator NlpD
MDATQGFGITIDDDKYRHIYWHLKEIKVKAGDIVESGDLIATADNTGIYTTGTHLHRGLYEITRDSNGKASLINKDNGYGGAIDIQPFYTGIFIKDYMDNLTAQLGILQQIIALIKKFLGK